MNIKNPIFKPYEYYLQFNPKLTKSKYDEIISQPDIFTIDDNMNVNCIDCIECYCCNNCINCYRCIDCSNCEDLACD